MKKALVALVLFMLVACAAAAEPADALARRLIDIADRLPGYQVVMIRQQRLGRDLSDEETILFKHRRDPECRYFKWLTRPYRNREAIYCAGRYDGKMRVHEPRLMGLDFSIDADGLLARRGNLRPVQQSGIYRMASMLKAEALRHPDSFLPPYVSERDVDGKASLCLRRDELPADETVTYPAAAAELCLDRASAMPTQVRAWHRDGRLMEDYRFRDWRLDAHLGDDAFDTANPAYGF